jgi:hypothetical protein
MIFIGILPDFVLKILRCRGMSSLNLCFRKGFFRHPGKAAKCLNHFFLKNSGIIQVEHPYPPN